MNTYKATRWGWRCFKDGLSYIPFNVQYENTIRHENIRDIKLIRGNTLISLTDEYVLIKFGPDPNMGLSTPLDFPPQFRIKLCLEDIESSSQDLQDQKDMCFILEFKNEVEFYSFGSPINLIQI